MGGQAGVVAWWKDRVGRGKEEEREGGGGGGMGARRWWNPVGMPQK